MIRLLFCATRQLTLGPARQAAACRLSRCLAQQQQQQWQRYNSGGGGTMQLTEGEKALMDKLKSKFPGAKHVEVSDISGGCGAMYQISIEAEEFRGKRTVMQHRMVNEVLAEEIKAMHGLQLNTKAPGDS
ncbi:hypothetical protein BaRGS_00034732 [Batillaria attramentaria]|uniref:Bola-like protein n=1 Tax=Batillaria attramentaria TaxID=370345 RepID=A0ABD0JGE1_9CAEN